MTSAHIPSRDDNAAACGGYTAPTPGRALIMATGRIGTLPGFGLRDNTVLTGQPSTIGDTATTFRRSDGTATRRPNDQLRLDHATWYREARAAGTHLFPRTDVIPAAWSWIGWTLADHIAFDLDSTPKPPLVIVGCGARKAEDHQRADRLYTGSYHRLALRAACSIAGDDRIRILSARNGLLTLHTGVDPYNTRLGDPGAITTSDLRDQARRLWLHDVDRVVVLAGRDYAELVRSVWPHAETPLAGTRGIGDQQRILARIAAGQADGLVS